MNGPLILALSLIDLVDEILSIPLNSNGMIIFIGITPKKKR